LVSIENLGFASYHAIQTEFLRRFANGWFFQASYVLSKNLGEAGTANTLVFPQELPGTSVTDRFSTRYDRGNFSAARRHRFLLTSIFPLPLGKRRALSGWELSTVTLLESGPYQTPVTSISFDQSNTDVAGRRVQARPDRIGNGNRANPTPDRFYDASAFTQVPSGAGRFGNAGAGILRGPGTVAVSAGLAKTFHLWEGLGLRMEATFTNFPNHPNFLPPNVNVTAPAFGKLTSVQSAENAGNRTGQLGIRLEF
jgi:hypothetical protein